MASTVINFEDVNVVFKNFSGKRFRSGEKTFTISLDKVTADQLAADGWNINYRPANEDYPESFLLPIAVSYKAPFPEPKVVKITAGANTKKLLHQNTVELLDFAKIVYSDISVRGREWQKDDGTKGVKAYLIAGYFTVEEDFFASKYGEIEDDAPEGDNEVPFA